MILALVRRDLVAVLNEKGRVAELVVFPLSFLVIWGLAFSGGRLPRDVVTELLTVNLIWTVSSVVQAQVNSPFLFDLWSREFAELLREGVTMHRYMAARVVFGTMMGLLNLAVFVAAVPWLFGVPWADTRPLLSAFPVYYTASIGLSYVVATVILRLGRSYGFLAWTGLQALVMLSSPYTPLSTNPFLVRLAAYPSPYTYVFEYSRTRDPATLAVGGVLAVLLLVAGVTGYVKVFRAAKFSGRLVSV